MKSLRLFDVKDIRLGDDQIPVPLDDEILVKVTAVGICGSDLLWFSEATTGDGGISKPFILGHEFGGIVESGETKGTRVTVDPHVPCNECEFCLDGNPNLCPEHHFAGQAPQDGALRELIAWPRNLVHSIPESFSDEDAAMLEPLGVAIHTIDLGKIRCDMTVGVYGCGPIGLMVIQLAKLAGATTIMATDRLPHRLEAAEKFGATQTILAERTEETKEILSATQDRGLDVTFEVAGDKDAVDVAIETCKPGGRVVLCGIPSSNVISFNASTARRKGLSILMVRRMKYTFPRAIELVKSGKVDIRSLVSHKYPLEKFEEAFEVAQRRKGLKVIINP